MQSAAGWYNGMNLASGAICHALNIESNIWRLLPIYRGHAWSICACLNMMFLRQRGPERGNIIALGLPSRRRYVIRSPRLSVEPIGGRYGAIVGTRFACVLNGVAVVNAAGRPCWLARDARIRGVEPNSSVYLAATHAHRLPVILSEPKSVRIDVNVFTHVHMHMHMRMHVHIHMHLRVHAHGYAYSHRAGFGRVAPSPAGWAGGVDGACGVRGVGWLVG